MQEIEREIGRDVGQLRHRLHYFGERRSTADVTHDECRHDALAQTAQRALEIIVAGRRFGQKKRAHHVTVSHTRGIPIQPDGDFRVRFERAYDLELQAWADAARRGVVTGPTAWDGYAATVVCEAGMASLASGTPVAVSLVDQETLA